MNQQIENRPTFNTCNSSLAHITCTTKLINTAARLVRAVHIWTSAHHAVKHNDFFAVLKA